MLYDYGAASADSVRHEAEVGLRRADALVAEVCDGEASRWSNPLDGLELARAAIDLGYGRSGFLADVHPEPSVRRAAESAREELAKWRVDLMFRQDVYRAVAHFAASQEAQRLTGERALLLEHWLRDLRRAGHELAPESRSRLQQLRSRLVELEVEFARNLAEYQDWIEVDTDDLEGLPSAFVDRLRPGSREGTLRVSLDYPELQPFLRLARRRHLREVLYRKHLNRAVPKNRPVMAEALQLRREVANLLGFPTWASYVLQASMANQPARVHALYDELVPPLTAAARAEIEEMRELHRQAGGHGDLQVWDLTFYESQQSVQRFGVDQQQLSEYFPLGPVLEGLFEFAGEMFGVTIQQLPDPKAWHPSVQLFEIRDRDSGAELAHFYADLFPREGKFTHAAAFPIVPGHRGNHGEYVKPVSAIVANFTPPSGSRPSLLTHGVKGEVETLFHEFGHILHMSLSQAEFPRFSAARTEADFVEAPSQIMQHWAWQPTVLSRFARHYHSGEALPAALAERVEASRFLNMGLNAARQVFYGTLDLALHDTATELDLDRALRDSWSITQFPYPEGTFLLAGFGHLMAGYDAGYYGYLWAEVIGDDMWSRFIAEGITSAQVGRDFRRAVLEPNGSIPADQLVHDFLGRPYSTAAFLRWRELAVTEA